MAILLSQHAVNHIYAKRAASLSGDAKLVISDTQASITASGELCWQVQTAESARYSMYISYSAATECTATISTGDVTESISLPATSGYFDISSNNFERRNTGIVLQLTKGISRISVALKGKCSIASIDLATSSAIDALLTSVIQMQQARASLLPYTTGYGFMFHWVGQSMPRSGTPMAYQDAVDRFNAEAFADMVADAGGQYVFFTTNHMYPHFPAPLREWAQRFPNMTTQRDLIADIGMALEKRGIALMLYINFTAALYPNDIANGERAQLSDFACAVFKAAGQRYGKLLKGWWVDSCYQLDRQFVNMDFEPLWTASKEGNSERITTFNYWILPTATPYVDFWAGEVCDIIKLPDDNHYEYGCAVNLPPHALLLMEDNWWHDKRDTPIISPRFTAAQLSDFIRGMNAHGGMVTINMQIYQDGGIGVGTMTEMQKLKRIIY